MKGTMTTMVVLAMTWSPAVGYGPNTFFHYSTEDCKSGAEGREAPGNDILFCPVVECDDTSRCEEKVRDINGIEVHWCDCLDSDPPSRLDIGCTVLLIRDNNGDLRAKCNGPTSCPEAPGCLDFKIADGGWFSCHCH